MGVLDDAIREHLELKRKHGATDEELARKESEALGPARRETPPPPEPKGKPEPDTGSPADAEPAVPSASEEAEPRAGDAIDDEALADDEVPATEILQEDDFRPAGGLNGRGAAEAAPPESEPHSPAYHDELAAEEELVADEAVVAEGGASDAVELPPDEDAMSRADEEEAPLADAGGDDVLLEDEPPHTSGFASDDELAERETLEHELPEDAALSPEDDAVSPAPAPPGYEPSQEAVFDAGEDDVLEDTPEFLEDTPEHDRLWFEQKSPRDFDFDD